MKSPLASFLLLWHGVQSSLNTGSELFLNCLDLIDKRTFPEKYIIMVIKDFLRVP